MIRLSPGQALHNVLLSTWGARQSASVIQALNGGARKRELYTREAWLVYGFTRSSATGASLCLPARSVPKSFEPAPWRPNTRESVGNLHAWVLTCHMERTHGAKCGRKAAEDKLLAQKTTHASTHTPTQPAPRSPPPPATRTNPRSDPSPAPSDPSTPTPPHALRAVPRGAGACAAAATRAPRRHAAPYS